ncbi:hypothetical protein F2Q69_00025532 [Brassica cretica]|uniref:Uncharacterized protein n=1 Tax=Brassica cretica TaxID=69181 RepID=A0A8S9S4L0_BRACR|nr:hypothetical protein F2Q69_00025532 [Brassica cretica]
MGFVVSRRSHCVFYLTACQSGCSFVHGLLGPHHHLMLHSSPNNPGCISEIFKLIHWCCVDCFGVFSWSVPSLGALDVVMSDISIPWVLFVDIYCPLSSSMECVPFPISSSTLSGFVSGSKTFKIRDTSDIEVLIKGSSKWCSISYVCVAISRIVNCALAAVSISGIISLNVVFNSQGLLSLCSLVVETRGLLHAISCLSVLYASIILCFIVIVVYLARMALLSCSINTFSLNGE